MESPPPSPLPGSPPAHPRDDAARHWIGWLSLIWLIACAALLAWKWQGIGWFALGDTDDNMRMAQVRAWLGGQGWFDLRQHKLDPAFGGASIHWSRLVDLPIAAVELIVRPLFGGAAGEKTAAAIAPLLPLWIALWAAALSARRLIAPAAFALAALLVFCGQNSLLMWMPLRVDHHGWQLALLAVAVAGAVDHRPARGGVTLGLASAASLTIGLEMLLYLAALGAIAALRWTWSNDEAARLRGYGVALAAGSAIGFAGFASWDNRAAVCDALSPVWLSVALFGGALLVALSSVAPRDWRVRLALAAAAGGLLAAGYAIAWPHCLGRLEGVSPELYDLWLKNVREAKPVYAHGWRTAWPIAALPIAGLAGGLLMLWRSRGDRAALGAWASAVVPATIAAALLLWQTRAAPAAQLLAVPGAAGLGWTLLPPLMRHRHEFVRLAGTVAAFLIVSGLIVPLVVQAIPQPKPGKARKAINSANRLCPTLPALRAIGRLPAATILTMVDLGPRIITVTHHRAIAGPYHRNQAAILDIHHAFRSADPEIAHGVMRRHGATLLLTCPGLSETTIYAAQNPAGFYAQLRDGKVPAWLAPVPLPKRSPFRLWRLVG